MPDIADQKARRRALWLAGIATLQALCAAFFFADAMNDFSIEGLHALSILEGAVSVVLILGTAASLLELRRAVNDAARARESLALASGAFGDVMRSRFDDWALSPAEADVALFLLKGLDASDIANLRGSATGTVRAQLAAVYKKSGVSNRTQFAALFLDDLIDGLDMRGTPSK
jgi:DNA-binding CsgD family transcriptional regulator